MLSLAVVSFGVWMMAILFALICLFMILVILIQKPKGGGLSSAFGGGGGGSQAVFGAKVGDALTWFTVVLFLLFLGIAIVITWMTEPMDLTGTPSVTSGTELPEGAGTGEGDGEDAAGMTPGDGETDAEPDAAGDDETIDLEIPGPDEGATGDAPEPAPDDTTEPPAEDAN